jgi:hypothetical protein
VPVRPACAVLAAAFLLVAAPLAAQVEKPSANLLRATRALPVFLPVNAAGNPLTSTPPGGGKPVVALFLRRAMAENMIAGIKAERADFGAQLKLQATMLAALLANRPAEVTFDFAFVPDPDEEAAAARELRPQNRSAMQGVPVFLLRSPTAGYVTITVDDRSVIPAFLGYGDVLALRQQAQNVVGAPATLLIEVTTLESLLAALQTSTDPFFANLLFQPSSAAAAEAQR